MAARRVDLILSSNPLPAVVELATAIQRALAPRYKVRLRRADEDGGEYVDGDSTPVAFRPSDPPLIIRLGEGEPTIST